MMRPPLINTDIYGSPFSASFLLPAFGQRDLSLLPFLAEDVDALLLQGCHRLLGQIRAICRGTCLLLDHVELQRDVRGALERGWVHHPDTESVWPDEGVHLVHLPSLMPLGQRRTVGEHDVDALPEVLATVGPPLERGREE